MIGLDISSEMIQQSTKSLTEKGLIDKFELICADIFDETFQVPEKVDCVVFSYVLSTFIMDQKMLDSILKRAAA